MSHTAAPAGAPAGSTVATSALYVTKEEVADDEVGGQHWPFGDHSSAYVALSSLTEFGNAGFSQTAEVPSAATAPRAPTHAPPKRHDGAP